MSDRPNRPDYRTVDVSTLDATHDHVDCASVGCRSPDNPMRYRREKLPVRLQRRALRDPDGRPPRADAVTPGLANSLGAGPIKCQIRTHAWICRVVGLVLAVKSGIQRFGGILRVWVEGAIFERSAADGHFDTNCSGRFRFSHARNTMLHCVAANSPAGSFASATT